MMRERMWFVTGTGTELGKTYVSCSILRGLRQRGVAVTALKPVLSGVNDAELDASDAGLFLRTLGEAVTPVSVGRIAPWRFRAALSPDMAARREQQSVSLHDVVAFCQSAAGGPLRLVEGAGGVMSPLGEWFTNLDLIVALGAKPVLVAGTYLGTISHTLTALEAMRVRGVVPAAIVLSQSDTSPVEPQETASTLSHFTTCPIMHVARGGEVPDALVDAIAA